MASSRARPASVRNRLSRAWRTASRDRLLCLCIGMGATLEETQRILKQATYAQIYPKIKRDAIIGHGIAHQADLDTINDNLFAENEKTLF